MGATGSKAEWTYTQWIESVSSAGKRSKSVNVSCTVEQATSIWLEHSDELVQADSAAVDADLGSSIGSTEGGLSSSLSTNKPHHNRSRSAANPIATESTPVSKGKFLPLYQKLCESYAQSVWAQCESAMNESIKSAERERSPSVTGNNRGSITAATATAAAAANPDDALTSQQRLLKYQRYFTAAAVKAMSQQSNMSKMLRAARATDITLDRNSFIGVSTAGGLLQNDGTIKWKLFNVYKDTTTADIDQPASPSQTESSASAAAASAAGIHNKTASISASQGPSTGRQLSPTYEAESPFMRSVDENEPPSHLRQLSMKFNLNGDD